MSRLTLVVVALSAFLAVVCAQLPQKMEGNYQRSACSCPNQLPGGGCDDLWLTQYNNVQAGSYLGQTGFLGVDPAGTRNLFFYSNGGAEWILSANAAQGAYYCHGAIGRDQITCETQNKTQQFCYVTFICTSGDCVTTTVTQNMRSIMFPIVGGLLGIVWLALAFLKGLPAETVIMASALAIFLFSLFLLIAPNVFPALLAMAFSALSLAASKSKGSWEIKLAIIAGIFVFLCFAGLNTLGASTWNFFDSTMDGFLSNTCFVYYGIPLASARCAQYLIFTAFLGFVIMMLAPLVVLLLVQTLGAEGK